MMKPDRTTAQFRIRSCPAAACFFIAGLLAAAPLAAKDDPYLRAITAEGNSTEYLGKAQKEQEALQRQASTAPSQPVAAVAISQKAFEDSLKVTFPGSFALYSLMEQHEKNEVYNEYLKRNVDGASRFLPVVTRIISITNAKRARKH
jgi:hypothetical protein